MCPPCRQTSSRFTSCYNKSQKNYLNRKDELAVRRIRPSLSSTKAFQAELFSDSSVVCPPLVLSPVTACFTTKKTSHDAKHSFSFRFGLDRPVDDSVSNDLGRIRHAWSATRVQTASCCPCAQDQLSTRSVWLFPSSISASWLCPLPHVRHIWSNALVSCSASRNKGIRSPRLVALARHRALKRLRPSVARWSTARLGHFTSLQSVRIQSLFH